MISDFRADGGIRKRTVAAHMLRDIAREVTAVELPVLDLMKRWPLEAQIDGWSAFMARHTGFIVDCRSAAAAAFTTVRYPCTDTIGLGLEHPVAGASALHRPNAGDQHQISAERMGAP
jgi:hypothetical protein